MFSKSLAPDIIRKEIVIQPEHVTKFTTNPNKANQAGIYANYNNMDSLDSQRK